jgi:hypothetical protein
VTPIITPVRRDVNDADWRAGFIDIPTDIPVDQSMSADIKVSVESTPAAPGDVEPDIYVAV